MFIVIIHLYLLNGDYSNYNNISLDYNKSVIIVVICIDREDRQFSRDFAGISAVGTARTEHIAIGATFLYGRDYRVVVRVYIFYKTANNISALW